MRGPASLEYELHARTWRVGWARTKNKCTNAPSPWLVAVPVVGAGFARVPGSVSFRQRPDGPACALGQNVPVKESLPDPLMSSWSVPFRATWGVCGGGGFMRIGPRVFGGTSGSENEGEHEGKWSARRSGPWAEGVEQREIRPLVQCACGLVATQRPGTTGTLSLCVRTEEGPGPARRCRRGVTGLPGLVPSRGPGQRLPPPEALPPAAGPRRRALWERLGARGAPCHSPGRESRCSATDSPELQRAAAGSQLGSCRSACTCPTQWSEEETQSVCDPSDPTPWGRARDSGGAGTHLPSEFQDGVIVPS